MTNEHISKFSDEITAYDLDASGVTITAEFAKAMLIAQPMCRLEEKGVIWVKPVGNMTDKATFTIVPAASWTFTDIDTRGSEVGTSTAFPAASLQAFPTPTYKEITVVTKSVTVYMHDNINLVNPIDFKDFAAVAGNAIRKQKIKDAFTCLLTPGSYVEATSIYNAGGFTAAGTVASDDTLSFDDLASAKDDLINQVTNPIVADVTMLHTTQKRDLESSSDLSPGQLTNANYKKARFSPEGTLTHFDGMEVIEYYESEGATQTTGDFTSVNGHYAIIGQKKLILGRAENNRKNKVTDEHSAARHGTMRTIDINYAYGILYPASIRLLQCSD